MTEKKAPAPSPKKNTVAKNRTTATSNSAEAFFTITESDEALLLQHRGLRLQIELVPSSCFWSNVRSELKKSDWDKIRLKVYEKTNSLCEICGGRGTKHPVECHEVWVYDDIAQIQRLSHFQSLCPLCHEVKHIGLAGVRGNSDRAFSRFIEINQLNKLVAEEIKDAVFKQWRIRSKQEWQLDIQHLKEWGITTS